MHHYTSFIGNYCLNTSSTIKLSFLLAISSPYIILTVYCSCHSYLLLYFFYYFTYKFLLYYDKLKNQRHTCSVVYTKKTTACPLYSMCTVVVVYCRKPCIEHLKIFGCAEDLHVAKNERKKLDLKTKKCIYLGNAAQS